MSESVRVERVNEVFMKVHCDDGLARDLYDFFSYTVPNAKFMPSVKNRFWDGKVRLFSIKTHQIYIGLLPYVDEFCRERGYDFDGLGILNVIGAPEFTHPQAFLDHLNLPEHITPRDYQMEAWEESIKYGRQLLLSPTASGKSLIIYMLCEWYGRIAPHHEKGRRGVKKMVIIVPTTALVEQMYKDFKEYGYKGQMCKIYSGQKVFDAPITITTWQSLSRAPKKTIESFDMVVGDEAHLFKAQMLKGILEKMKKTAVRFGTTGTLDGSEVHRLQLEGMFGPVKKVISSSELMEDGTIANLSIDCVILKHPKQKKMSYQDEMDYLVGCDSRNKFLCNLVYSLKGNTLILFQFVEKHGEILHKKMFSKLGKKLHYVYGGTDTLDREEVRTIVEKNKDHVILASYGTFSTGVNIKRIDNIVFASPSKSRIRNLQSIGRGLRKTDDKDSMRLFDIADDLQNKNYTLNHLKDRINIYNEENFVYQIKQFDLK